MYDVILVNKNSRFVLCVDFTNAMLDKNAIEGMCRGPPLHSVHFSAVK